MKAPLTPVTPETFAAWKKTRLAKKEAEEEAASKAKQQQRAAGKLTGMTGKDLFDYGGEMFEDEEETIEEAWDISRMLARYVSTARVVESDKRGAVADSSDGGRREPRQRGVRRRRGGCRGHRGSGQGCCLERLEPHARLSVYVLLHVWLHGVWGVGCVVGDVRKYRPRDVDTQEIGLR